MPLQTGDTRGHLRELAGEVVPLPRELRARHGELLGECLLLRLHRQRVRLRGFLRRLLGLLQRRAERVELFLRLLELAARRRGFLLERRRVCALRLEPLLDLAELAARVRLRRRVGALCRGHLRLELALLQLRLLQRRLQLLQLLTQLRGFFELRLERVVGARRAGELARRLRQTLAEPGNLLHEALFQLGGLRRRPPRVVFATLRHLRQRRLHAALLLEKRLHARRRRRRGLGALRSAALERGALGGERGFRLLRRLDRPRDLRLDRLLRLGQRRLQLRLVHVRRVQRGSHSLVGARRLARDARLDVGHLRLQLAHALAVCRRLRVLRLARGVRVRLAALPLRQERCLSLRVRLLGGGARGDGVRLELGGVGASRLLLLGEHRLEPRGVLVELLERLLGRLRLGELLHLLALRRLLRHDGLLQLGDLRRVFLLESHHALLELRLVPGARLLLGVQRRLRLRLRRRGGNLGGGELLVERLHLLQPKLLLRGELLGERRLLLLDGGHLRARLRSLRLHALRLGLELALRSLQRFLRRRNLRLLRVHLRLERLGLLRGGGGVGFAVAAFLAKRLLQRRALCFGRLGGGGELFVGGDAVGAALVALALELRGEPLELLLERLQRLRRRVRGAVELRLLHGARLLLRGDQRLQARDLLLRGGHLLARLRRGGGGVGDVLAAALLLGGELLFGIRARLVFFGKRQRVRLGVLLEHARVRLHQTVHLHPVRLPQRFPHLGLAELRLLDDHHARLLFVLRLRLLRLCLFALELRGEVLRVRLQLGDSRGALLEGPLELGVRVVHALLERRGRRGGLVARLLQRGELAHLLGGALELGLLQRFDFFVQGHNLVAADIRRRGGGGEAHAEHAVLHARLLGARLLLVPVHAHVLQLLAHAFQLLRVALDGGGEHALRLSKRRRRSLGRLERGERRLQGLAEARLVCPGLLQVLQQRLALLLRLLVLRRGRG